MLISLLILLFSFGVFAHQPNLTGGGKSLRWTSKNIPITIRSNSQTLNSTTATQIIRNSVNQWNQTSTAQLIETSSSNNEVNFSNDFSMYGPGVIGMTEIIYNESTGNIQKASILLNEDNFVFSSTQGFQNQINKVYLGDVITHEIGHFWGLSHSEVLNSTMFYSSFPGQSSLAADDKAGVRSLYDSNTGKIFGYVKGGRDIGVLGTHIQAISLKTGESIGSISKADGYFEISGLDINDSYYLYTSPVKKVDSLPGYFSTLQTSFCPSSYVGSFFNACGKPSEGLPQKIHLSSSQAEINVGAVTINCSLRTNEEYSYEKIQQNFLPITIWYPTSNDQNHFAFTGYFRSNEINTASFSQADKLRIDLSQFSNLSGNQKFLKVSLISQPLGSPVEYTLNVKRNNITQIGPLTKVRRNLEGTFNLDVGGFISLQSNSSQNVYDIEIQAKRLATEDLADAIPSATLFSNSQHFPYLLVASVWESTANGMVPYEDTEVLLSDNKNCLDAPFTYAVSNSKSTDSSNASVSDKSEGAAVAGCGTIEPPQGGGPGSALPLMALGFLLSLFASQLMKNRKIFLS